MTIDFGVDDALDNIAEHVRARTCVLFLGSAVHAPPPADSIFRYPDEERPDLAWELAARLAQRCPDYPSFDAVGDGSLQRIALLFELSRSRRQLVEAIEDAVQRGKRPSQTVRALAKMDFPLVVTTNYDDLYEQALRERGSDPLVIVRSRRGGRPTVEDLSGDRPVVVKLHGDFSSPESMVVTEDDYIDFIGQMTGPQMQRPVSPALLRTLRTWPTLFIGYGHGDFNVKVIFRPLGDAAFEGPRYTVDRAPDPLARELSSRLGRGSRFVVGNVWRIVPDLYAQVFGEELTPERFRA